MDLDAKDVAAVLMNVRQQAASGAVRMTLHAAVERAEEGILLNDVLEAISAADAVVVECYPQHRRGACCLVGGSTRAARPLHVVCASAQPVLIIITVYEPKRPKWSTPTERGPR
jgi:hypothetical protein